MKQPEFTRTSMGFNCTKNGEVPDWSEFVSFEFNPCLLEDYGDETHTVAYGLDEVKPCGKRFSFGEKVSFWTVYGRLENGCASAIHDCDTREQAEELLKYCNSMI
ncbi:hypothetical protein [Vibrio barjaei]|uniref:hypothetical protein n=1 Tax=Vibrio barjaei TaxID=1676683 RepID=UPI002283508E|nr:hypothetical protein [Vibrio barjaei]MCY9874066.1 hypothetical protein [Vibrio barjaei]